MLKHIVELTDAELEKILRGAEQIKALIDFAKTHNSWVVLAGHEIGTGGNQTTRVAMLEELITYAADPANGVWLAPVGEVARYIESRR